MALEQAKIRKIIDRIVDEDLCNDSVQPSFCSECGEEGDEMEPDGYGVCESCGGKTHGAENFVIMFG